MIDGERLREFSKEIYEGKDLMHNFTHIERVLNLSLEIAKGYEGKVNKDYIVYGAYFHGFIWKEDNGIEEFLRKEKLGEKEIKNIMAIAWESQKDKDATTLEGKILHDAHMLEGGKTFLIAKSLVTGTARGQSLEETITYIEDNILDKGNCYLEKSQEQYREKQEFAKQFIIELKKGLELI